MRAPAMRDDLLYYRLSSDGLRSLRIRNDHPNPRLSLTLSVSRICDGLRCEELTCRSHKQSSKLSRDSTCLGLRFVPSPRGIISRPEQERARARLRLSRLERIRTECTTMQLGRSCLKGEVSPRRNPRPLLFRRDFAVNSAMDRNGFKLQVGASRLCLTDPRFSDSGRYRPSDRCIFLSLSLSRILGKSPRGYPHACDTTRQIFAGEGIVGSCDSLSFRKSCGNLSSS